MGSIINILQESQRNNSFVQKNTTNALGFVDEENCGHCGTFTGNAFSTSGGSLREKCVESEKRKSVSTRNSNRKASYFLDWKAEENLPMDFCKNSSLHGLKYIGERRQHFVERMFWTAAFTTALVVACIMISDVWKKYKNNSVIITFAPYETKIEELPFPAVTICNMNKILKSKAMKIMNEANGLSGVDKRSEALENLYYLNHVCSTSRSFTKMFNYSAERGKIDRKILNNANMNQQSYDGGKEDLWNFFVAASPLCSDMIIKCIWQKEVRDCTELFTPLETDNGKCCTFNMVPPSILHRFNMTGMKEDPSVTKNWEWDRESLVKSRKKKEQENSEHHYPDFPRRQKIPGQSFGLSILLNPGLEEYFCTSSDSHGFRMTAHLPIDVPQISDFGLAIKPNSEVFVNIRPEVTIADKDTIGSFPAEQRECYFNGERDLGYYTFYTQKNCIDECLANLTYQECHCRRHYQPGEDSKPLCGPKQFHCASNIKRKFVGTYKTRCRSCIPTCNEIQYHTETTYTPLQEPEILWRDHYGQMAPWAGKNVSVVHIFFGADSTNAKLRKELYGVIDLIANFGGLMGLCLGFSGLSLIELFYFLTLRAWCRVRRGRNGAELQGKKAEKVRVPRRKKSLKRTETITELIDFEEEPSQSEEVDDRRGENGEEDEEEEEEEGDGAFLEMRSMARDMMVNRKKSGKQTRGTLKRRAGGSGISVISKGPVFRTRKAIEAILHTIMERKARGNSGIVGSTGNNNGVIRNSFGDQKEQSDGRNGRVSREMSTVINLAPIVESEGTECNSLNSGNSNGNFAPLGL